MAINAEDLTSAYRCAWTVQERLRELDREAKSSWQTDDDQRERMSVEEMRANAERLANLSAEAAFLWAWVEESGLDTSTRFVLFSQLSQSLCDEAAGWLVDIARREIRVKVREWLEAI
jgi:hypothetical protein